MTDVDSSSDENKLITERRKKLAQLRADKSVAYPNDFRRNALTEEIIERFAASTAEQLEQLTQTFCLAGRMMAKRIMGKASFCQVQDMSGRLQIFLQRDALGDEVYQAFKTWDVGDIIGCSGTLFKTKTGELSLRASEIQLLTKSLRPLPEKFHGLTDQEQRFRMRYVDLIMNAEVRDLFAMRSRVMSGLRAYMVEQGFLEVETPMMHPIPGGATARPFITHHNALDMQLYLRIAPELYLKRLVVGGFEKVFEINRSFRNEGLSTRHNPEFTMMEYYEAYADYGMLMDRTEDFLRRLAKEIFGREEIIYQGHKYDLVPAFTRLTVLESIRHYNQELSSLDLTDRMVLRQACERLNIPVRQDYGIGKLQIEIFEKTVEPKLMQPTFITEYPTEVSPLARRNDRNPDVTDRFEFFIAGKEIANGFSELNDAEDQAQRFREQAKQLSGGDFEAMHYDDDYIKALEYGMPPTAGEGIGIDRLIMLFADVASIREVLLFPLLRPETSDLKRDYQDQQGNE